MRRRRRQDEGDDVEPRDDNAEAGPQVAGTAAVCWLNALAAMATALLYRSSARPYLNEPQSPDPETSRTIRKYIGPLIPGMVFYAFQGQIQVFLISVFGQNQSIAEVTALGRLGQLFMFLSSFNATILAPYIARAPIAQLALRYTQAISLTAVIAALLCAAAFLFPAIFLWLLGPKYHGLRIELFLSLIAASLSFINATLYTFNNARHWVYHWTGIASVTGMLIIQTILVATMDLSTTLNVMLFSIATAAYPIFIFSATAFHGYRKTVAASLTAQ